MELVFGIIGHLEEWRFWPQAGGLTGWRRSLRWILRHVGHPAPDLDAVCGLIRPTWRPDCRFQVLSDRQCAVFKHDQATHIVGQILHADLHSGLDDADGAHKLAAHAVVLVAEHMLDPSPNF